MGVPSMHAHTLPSHAMRVGVGARVGADVGNFVGARVVGESEGTLVGATVGLRVGSARQVCPPKYGALHLGSVPTSHF